MSARIPDNPAIRDALEKDAMTWHTHSWPSSWSFSYKEFPVEINSVNLLVVVLNTAAGNPLDGTRRYMLSTTGLQGAQVIKAKWAYENLDDINNEFQGRQMFLESMKCGDYATACKMFDEHCTAVEISIMPFDNVWDGSPIITPEITRDIDVQLENIYKSNAEDSVLDEVDSFHQDEEFGGQFEEP